MECSGPRIFQLGFVYDVWHCVLRFNCTVQIMPAYVDKAGSSEF